MHATPSCGALTVLLTLLHLLAATAQASNRFNADLPPGTRWTHCIDDGRANIRFSVDASTGKLHSGLILPRQLEACKPSKVTGCKWLLPCDAAQHCSKFFPGELSGRQKCLVVINTSDNTAKTASITVDLEPAGNWGAIILGVTVTTLGLVTVVAAGCYSDLRSLATGHHRRIPKAAQRSGAGEARWPPQPDLLQQPSSNGLHTRATR